MQNELTTSLNNMRLESCVKLAAAIRRAQDITRHSALTTDNRTALLKALGEAAPLLVEAEQFKLLDTIAAELIRLGAHAVSVRALIKFHGYEIPNENGLRRDEIEAINDLFTLPRSVFCRKYPLATPEAIYTKK